MVRITLVTTSARVPPGVLTASAWDLLRSVPVFCGSPGHPQRAALAEAGVPVEVVDVGAGAVRFVGENGHPAGGGMPAVSETFVAAMRALADGAGVTEVAWLAEPAHMLPLPAPSGPGPDADDRPEPAAGVSDEPATGLPGPGLPGQPDTAGEGLVSAASAGAEVRVLAGTRELPGSTLLDAVAVMDRLRSPGGCPWDAEQTHASLAPYLLEEAYEAYQAIEDGNLAELREELGDVLLQVLFHARLAAEGSGGSGGQGDVGDLGGDGGLSRAVGGLSGAGGGKPGSGGPGGWDVDAVAAGLVAKLVRRHPHVFGKVTVDGAEAVAANWEVIKDAEKGRASVTDGIPASLPALSLARKLLARSGRIGVPFDLAADPAAGDAADAGDIRDTGDVRDAGGTDASGPGEFDLPADSVAGDADDVRDADDRGNAVPDLPGAISALAYRITRITQIAHDTGRQDAAEEDDAAQREAGEEVATQGVDDGRHASDLDTQVGRLLFAAVALAATAGVDPEAALRRVTRTFRDRIIELERRISNNV